MYPQNIPSVFLWIGFCITTQQVMDVQKDLIGWLDEVTLFSPTKQQQQQHFEDEDPFKLCFDDLIGSTDPQKQKVHDEALIDLPDVSDILADDGWMDEKIDLSILDASHDWLEQPNGDEKYGADARGESDVAVASYMDYLLASSDTIQPLQQISPESPGGSGTFLAHDVVSDSISEVATSPEAVPLEFIPLEVGLQSPSSPAASFSSGTSSSAGIPSPFSVEQTLDGSDASAAVDPQCPVGYFVEVDSQAAYRDASPQARASTSASAGPDKLPKGREGRSHKEASRLRKSLKSAAQARHPYRQPKTESRYERKKVQNKEAAARYRVKKKEQDRVLSDEVASLEAEQEKLKEKHDKLKSEVSYLKSLLKELFQARGLIKKQS